MTCRSERTHVRQFASQKKINERQKWRLFYLVLLLASVYKTPGAELGFGYDRAMASDAPDQRKLLEAWLVAEIASLEAERARIDVERARVDANLARYRTSLAGLLQVPEAVPAEVPKDGVFAGLSLTDAIAKYLGMHDEMKSAKEIWTALEKSGFKVLSGYPERAVRAALRERESAKGDVFRAGGRYGAKDNFSPAAIKRATKKHAGMGGRTHKEHAALTSEGIERRRAAGLPVGKRLFMTPERLQEIERRIRGGETVREIAEGWGITKPAIYAHFKRDRIKQLREEGPLPEASGLRLVK